MTDLPDLQQLASQTSHQLDPLVLVQPCPQSPWNPQNQQDPQKPDPQDPVDPLVQKPLNHLKA